jgi:hypothetical protein
MFTRTNRGTCSPFFSLAATGRKHAFSSGWEGPLVPVGTDFLTGTAKTGLKAHLLVSVGLQTGTPPQHAPATHVDEPLVPVCNTKRD